MCSSDLKIKDFEQKGNNWLEPMKEMILASSQAKILLSQSDNQQIRSFLKNVGSNFILARSGLFLFLLLKFIFFDSIKMKANTILILCYQNFEDMASNKNTIGNNVKKLRAKLDLTQDDLARKSGVKYTTLSKIESGVVTKPTVHIIAKIAKALDVSIEDLLR